MGVCFACASVHFPFGFLFGPTISVCVCQPVRVARVCTCNATVIMRTTDIHYPPSHPETGCIYSLLKGN